MCDPRRGVAVEDVDHVGAHRHLPSKTKFFLSTSLISSRSVAVSAHGAWRGLLSTSRPAALAVRMEFLDEASFQTLTSMFSVGECRLLHEGRGVGVLEESGEVSASRRRCSGSFLSRFG